MERAANRAERLLELEALLLGHPDGLHRAEIARRLGVHRSTAGRDVDALSGRVPVWEDDGGRVGINRDDRRNSGKVSVQEHIHGNRRVPATAIDWVR